MEAKGSEFALNERVGQACAKVAFQLLLAVVCLALGAYVGSLALQWGPLIGISETPPGLVYKHRADDTLPPGWVVEPDDRL